LALTHWVKALKSRGWNVACVFCKMDLLRAHFPPFAHTLTWVENYTQTSDVRRYPLSGWSNRAIATCEFPSRPPLGHLAG